MKFFTLYDKPSPVGTACRSASLTVQSEKSQCDINLIIARYKKTGVIDHVKRDSPLYADCEEAISALRRAEDLVEQTHDAFWSLPSDVRDQIGEPSRLPSWAAEHRDDAIKYGFLASAPAQAPTQGPSLGPAQAPTQEPSLGPASSPSLDDSGPQG